MAWQTVQRRRGRNAGGAELAADLLRSLFEGGGRRNGKQQPDPPLRRAEWRCGCGCTSWAERADCRRCGAARGGAPAACPPPAPAAAGEAGTAAWPALPNARPLRPRAQADALRRVTAAARKAGALPAALEALEQDEAAARARQAQQRSGNRLEGLRAAARKAAAAATAADEAVAAATRRAEEARAAAAAAEAAAREEEAAQAAAAEAAARGEAAAPARDAGAEQLLQATRELLDRLELHTRGPAGTHAWGDAPEPLLAAMAAAHAALEAAGPPPPPPDLDAELGAGADDELEEASAGDALEQLWGAADNAALLAAARRLRGDRGARREPAAAGRPASPRPPRQRGAEVEVYWFVVVPYIFIQALGEGRGEGDGKKEGEEAEQHEPLRSASGSTERRRHPFLKPSGRTAAVAPQTRQTTVAAGLLAGWAPAAGAARGAAVGAAAQGGARAALPQAAQHHAQHQGQFAPSGWPPRAHEASASSAVVGAWHGYHPAYADAFARAAPGPSALGPLVQQHPGAVPGGQAQAQTAAASHAWGQPLPAARIGRDPHFAAPLGQAVRHALEPRRPPALGRQREEAPASEADPEGRAPAPRGGCAPGPRPAERLEPRRQQDTQSQSPTSIDDDGLCVVCLSSDRSHAFVPCGHRCVCKERSPRRGEDGPKCPLCRSDAVSTLHIFN
ncbi:unnamed protein product [Prorocentrum cordatum]|uniref:RING-type domain-containing protein n=1 Tax=Prorocentrum cordatum TaxID=2364126 RepID=A0ABN9TCP5_9DINO|nr:unnamed protein product [Polarella glacialis]